jgi:adenylate kinase family enzyme
MERPEVDQPSTNSGSVGQRICVIGNAGTGKSRVAQSLADRLGLRYIDRDRMVWGPGWTMLLREERVAVFEKHTRASGWTYDGHLRASRPEERLVLERCDTIIWLDLSRWQVMRSITWRTLRRVVTRQRLWNGNIETWRMFFSREFSIGWAWRMHSRLGREYDALFADPRHRSRRLIRLHSRAEVDQWLAGVCGSREQPTGLS